ncbi:N-acetyltransferase family protein [Ferruginibacter sp. SUN002]|uniref:GNAT family N-acetyltransferase n=1 Tax=Ferruginibacter sp. SUN002 TaxID=2937789 RepID=UPI003D35B7AB
MDIKIRRLGIEDAPALTVIAQQTFFDTFDGTCTESDMQHFLNDIFSVQQHITELENTDTFYFFAELDGLPVGYMKFQEDYSSFEEIKKWKALELKRIYVSKEYHGKGIAQKLMDFYLDYAIANKFEVVWLGVWDQNFKAQKFYEKYGFVNSGFDHDFPIGETPQTDFWYWKFL